MRWAWMVVLLTALLAPPVVASPPTAGGVSVSWGDACWSDAGAASNLTWACDSNTYGGIRMTCSFQLDAGTSDFYGVGVFMNGMTETSQVPDWWKLGDNYTYDCRMNLLSLSADGSFSSACVSPWQGVQAGGIGLYAWDCDRMYVNGCWAMQDPVALDAGVEYFALQFRISAARTVGGCAGCSVPAIWALHRIEVSRSGGTWYLDSPYSGGNQCLTWQSSTLSCWYPLPVRNATWGQLKSLYR